MEITTIVGPGNMENLDLDFGKQGNIAIFREQRNEVLKLEDHFRE